MARQAAWIIGICVVALAATAAAQEPEIYLGEPVGPAPGVEKPVNYLARCINDPDDRISCHVAATADTDGGLESAVRGNLNASAYVPCGARQDVCLELATLDLGEPPDPAKPKPRLVSVDVTIAFAFNATAILDAEAPKLDQLTAALKDPVNADAGFAVIGHTDAKGTKAYNCRLSRARARTVANRLAANGIDMARLSVIAAGEEVLRNKIDGEAAENRRVGFAKLTGAAAPVLERLSGLCPDTNIENRLREPR